MSRWVGERALEQQTPQALCSSLLLQVHSFWLSDHQQSEIHRLCRPPLGLPILTTVHLPFTLDSWELLLQDFFVLCREEAKALELAGTILRPEAQLLPVLDKASWMVPAVNHTQLWLLRVQHFLGEAHLALWGK